MQDQAEKALSVLVELRAGLRKAFNGDCLGVLMEAHQAFHDQVAVCRAFGVPDEIINNVIHGSDLPHHVLVKSGVECQFGTNSDAKKGKKAVKKTGVESQFETKDGPECGKKEAEKGLE